MDIDTDAPVSLQSFSGQLETAQPAATFLCPLCKAPIPRNTGLSMCEDCIRLNVDVSSGIQREGSLHFCKGCDRYLQPPQHWVAAPPESKELMSLCLKRLRGLAKVRLVDASFIWTEPHSKRIKLKIKVQEAFESTFLVQTFEVEFVVVYTQCSDCAKTYTPNTWRACVQIRQKVAHKRTFLYLEQLILKHNAHKDCINIRETKDGLDFFFAQRNHAVKLCDFLAAVTPVRSQKSSELISQDIHTSTKSYKFTYSIEIVPVCKDDLVCLPKKTALSLGNIPQLLLCTRVGNSVHLMDPNTLATAEITNNTFWRSPFVTLADVTTLTEFMVLQIEPTGTQRGKYILSNIDVMRLSDNTEFSVRTHLGSLLHEGDIVLGYDLSGSNFNDDNFESLNENNIPAAILVKKHYPRKKKNKNRNWKLKRMQREESEMLPRKQDQEKAERDYNLFLESLEEDQELRSTVALYKARRHEFAGGDVDMKEEGDESEVGDEGPVIGMDELLDEFDELDIKDRA